MKILGNFQRLIAIVPLTAEQKQTIDPAKESNDQVITNIFIHSIISTNNCSLQLKDKCNCSNKTLFVGWRFAPDTYIAQPIEVN